MQPRSRGCFTFGIGRFFQPIEPRFFLNGRCEIGTMSRQFFALFIATEQPDGRPSGRSIESSQNGIDHAHLRRRTALVARAGPPVE